MANPKRRHSKTRKNKRRSHHALAKANLVECPNCSAYKAQHVVCRECGYYGGKKVIEGTEL